jgi:hypothetical protein
MGVILKRIILLISLSMPLIFSSCGCPSMEQVHNELLLRNNSQRSVQILLNLSYPDSSLQMARIDNHIDPNREKYIGNYIISLHSYNGVSIFVFDEQYFDSKWNEGVKAPDTYLETTQILKKYVLSRKQLDSLGWRLVYP